MKNAEPPLLYMPNPLLNWLFARQHFMTPDFTRVKALLEQLGRPQDAFASILVTGTNGKGSVSSSLHSILHRAGARTGRFTSPHLSYFAERFVVNQQILPQAEVLERLAAIKPLAEAEGNSFFEIVTALACCLFADNGVELAVMEIGMGGQFDTTNVLEPKLSLISNISLDHTRYLGESIAKIAQTKAHIMRPKRPCYTTASAGLSTLQSHAKDIGAELRSLCFSGQLLGWQGVEVHYDGITARSPLLGKHQIANVALAMAAGKYLGASKQAIQQGIGDTIWAGRLEKISYQGKTILLDGAHNPASARALAQALEDLQVEKPLVIFGSNSDKDIAAIAPYIDAIAERIILSQSQLSPKATVPHTMLQYFHSPSICIPKPQHALDEALKQPEQIIVVAGSLYLVGEIRPRLLEQPSETWERWQ